MGNISYCRNIVCFVNLWGSIKASHLFSCFIYASMIIPYCLISFSSLFCSYYIIVAVLGNCGSVSCSDIMQYQLFFVINVVPAIHNISIWLSKQNIQLWKWAGVNINVIYICSYCVIIPWFFHLVNKVIPYSREVKYSTFN